MALVPDAAGRLPGLHEVGDLAGQGRGIPILDDNGRDRARGGRRGRRGPARAPAGNGITDMGEELEPVEILAATFQHPTKPQVGQLGPRQPGREMRLVAGIDPGAGQEIGKRAFGAFLIAQPDQQIETQPQLAGLRVGTAGQRGQAVLEPSEMKQETGTQHPAAPHGKGGMPGLEPVEAGKRASPRLSCSSASASSAVRSGSSGQRRTARPR